jgi:hypothetical protein
MEATLEAEVKKPSRFSQVVDQLKEWREPENRTYLDHYMMNCAKIMFGYNPTDYSIISHKNAVVHSWIKGIDDLPGNKVCPENKIVGSMLFNLETGK